MESNARDAVDFYLLLPSEHLAYLANLRDWEHLKFAVDHENTWVTGFNLEETKSTLVRSIPFKQLFYANEGHLYPENSVLPCQVVPSLLWTSIKRGLPVRLPSFNHNYFGIKEKLSVSLVPSSIEREAQAIIAPLSILSHYLSACYEVRLKPLSWVIIEETDALIFGTPLLPLNTETYWQEGSSLYPTGYELKLKSLASFLNKRLNPTDMNFILWKKDGSYALIPKDKITPLSISSFKTSIKH